MKQYGGYQVVSFIFACEFYYATKYKKLKLNYRNKKNYETYNYFYNKLHFLK